jgi:hypothetical protein
LQVFYGLRSERQLMEQLNYNLLFRWFVGLSPDDPVWDATTFTKNRDRLQRGDVFRKFMERLLDHPRVKPLLSDEHFSVDGTLIEAWASHKSFQPKDGSDDGDGSNFHGQRRKNDTHQSTSDPQAKLYRKAAGREAKLCYMGHAVMENRNGLAVDGTVTQASGTAERRASEAMLKKKTKRSGRRITVGEDKAYDTSDHVAALREMNITPHVAQNDSLTKTGKHRSSAVGVRPATSVTASPQSCRGRMKGNERISGRVQEIVGRAAERAEVSLERVLRELKAIAFSNISKAVTWGPSVQVREEEENGHRVKVGNVNHGGRGSLKHREATP